MESFAKKVAKLFGTEKSTISFINSFDWLERNSKAYAKKIEPGKTLGEEEAASRYKQNTF